MGDVAAYGAEGLAEGLGRIVGPGRALANEPMSGHTTFGIGGPADVLVTPGDVVELRAVCGFLRDKGVAMTVLGGGSNVLVGDGGIRGAVVRLSRGMAGIRAEGEVIVSGSAATMPALAMAALEGSLSGLEFAEGIPGSVGGGVCMNAGAYGGEVSGTLIWSDCLDGRGEPVRLDNERHGFGNRSSAIQGNGYIILESAFRLRKGDKGRIAALMADYAGRRRDRQPTDLPSAGSVFKRPKGDYAGRLIEESGLRGHRVGGAMVSEKHCGFIVNVGGATAGDVLALIDHVRRVVLERTGVTLETEVRMLGEFGSPGRDGRVGGAGKA